MSELLSRGPVVRGITAPRLPVAEAFRQARRFVLTRRRRRTAAGAAPQYTANPRFNASGSVCARSGQFSAITPCAATTFVSRFGAPEQ